MSAPNDANPENKPDAKPETTPPDAGTPKTFSQEELDAAVTRALKAERDTATKKAKEAALPELEKVKLQAETAHAELRTLRAKDALTEAAQAAKAKSPAKIYRLYVGELLFGEDGKPTNIAAIVTAAKKDFPEEFDGGGGGGKGSADGGAGGNTKTGGSMNDWIRAATGRK